MSPFAVGTYPMLREWRRNGPAHKARGQEKVCRRRNHSLARPEAPPRRVVALHPCKAAEAPSRLAEACEKQRHVRPPAPLARHQVQTVAVEARTSERSDQAMATQ